MTSSAEVTANVHALAVPVEALDRLLHRCDGDGALAPADPALIRLAIEATRGEVRRAATMLEGVAADTTGVERSRVAAMTAMLIYLRGLLETLEATLNGLVG